MNAESASPPTFQEVESDARGTLEKVGLFAVVPPVRSSDYELVCRSPFYYYLSRRLGLIKSLRHTTALSRGTWFHEGFRHLSLDPSHRRDRIEDTLASRSSELSDVCAELGVSPDKRREILLRERQDVESSLAWFEAARQTRISSEYGSFQQFLERDHFRVLGRECRLVTSVSKVANNHTRVLKSVAQPDLLLYHKGQNSVWIVDAKTTGHSPLLRASTIPYEFQARHYLTVARRLIDRGMIQRQFDLPSDATLGGMIHVIVRKPTIEFGMKDRHYEIDDTPFKSGPRKGQPRNERKYFGEPVWENYLERVRHWYAATEEYEHLRPQWDADPPVNLSITSGRIVDDPDVRKAYEQQFRLVQTYAWRKPDPLMFPMPSNLVHYGKLDDYADFVMNPVESWPSIIEQEGWSQIPRDQIPEDVLEDVIPDPESEFD